jgi:hypothetical protein
LHWNDRRLLPPLMRMLVVTTKPTAAHDGQPFVSDMAGDGSRPPAGHQFNIR